MYVCIYIYTHTTYVCVGAYIHKHTLTHTCVHIQVRMLLLHGANQEHRDIYSSTALHDAALSGRTATASLLLDFKADVDARNNRCVYVCMYVYWYLLIHARNKRRVYVCMCIVTYCCMYVCMYTWYTCMYVYRYLLLHARYNRYMYTYIHAHCIHTCMHSPWDHFFASCHIVGT
jgi:hypothetical protein